MPPQLRLLGGKVPQPVAALDLSKRDSPGIEAKGPERFSEHRLVFCSERMLLGVGSKRLDGSGHVNGTGVHRVAKAVRGTAADDDLSLLEHEAGHVPH